MLKINPSVRVILRNEKSYRELFKVKVLVFDTSRFVRDTQTDELYKNI